jgi:hypothetical protein
MNPVVSHRSTDLPGVCRRSVGDRLLGARATRPRFHVIERGRVARARAPNSAHQQQGASPCRGNGIQPRIRNQLRRREAGWRAGGGELAARRSTNVIRSDEQASRRAKVKPCARGGVAVSAEWEPAKAGTVVMWRLTMGRWEVVVRGLGISGCISAGASRAPRRQRRHSTVETGESRWREGRQEIGMPR